MTGRSFCFGVALLLVTVSGCGGGSSSSSNTMTKVVIRQRTIASARLMRAIFALAGLGKPVTRGAAGRREHRAGIAVAALRQSRDVAQGVDDGTKLTFTRTVNADGSGREDLFADFDAYTACRRHHLGRSDVEQEPTRYLSGHDLGHLSDYSGRVCGR